MGSILPETHLFITELPAEGPLAAGGLHRGDAGDQGR